MIWPKFGTFSICVKFFTLSASWAAWAKKITKSNSASFFVALQTLFLNLNRNLKASDLVPFGSGTCSRWLEVGAGVEPATIRRSRADVLGLGHEVDIVTGTDVTNAIAVTVGVTRRRRRGRRRWPRPTEKTGPPPRGWPKWKDLLKLKEPGDLASL